MAERKQNRSRTKRSAELGRSIDVPNLKLMRQFYFLYPKGAAAWHLLSWSHLSKKCFVLSESKQLFASQYRMVLPTEEELRREIERERDLAVHEQEARYG